ncbi:helix-turn-helix transcriptional regulator [Actinomycetospora endophytica]|uniref:Helix-turn-helix transcriptional regulator n=1 Tax=Actinomycetospora endophytica TaxID=2291215 RepID=A0ABS8P7E7_9PSEU|nr:helix-turn-helix domain-containing protein [Actinomycetospora endophytica]MCD2194163.1 helix-turn-helix transcriptional regulator [Actinomycetospora endophytica]
MPLGQGYPQQDCAMARALEVVGDRWTLLVLRDCFFGVHRFADLVAHLDVPRAVLSDRLARLVDAGLLHRDGSGYRVTEDAATLWPALRSLATWGESRQRSDGGTVRRFAHAGCPAGGEPDTDPDGRCPRCGAVPGPADLVVRPEGGPDVPRRDDDVSRALRASHRMQTPLP